MARDKLREVLAEKIHLENQLNHLERVEDSRLNDFEHKYTTLSLDYKRLIDENQILRKSEAEVKKELKEMVRGRDAFKEQFLELREINKDLRQRFKEIEK